MTEYIKGDYVSILLYEPSGISNKSKFTINNVIYVYKNINETNTFDGIYTPTGILPCHLDISQYPEWNRESNAIAQIDILTTEGKTKACSGALIMNQNQDFKPYLLTAFHCLDFNHDDQLIEDEKNTLKSWKFNFKYKSNTHRIMMSFNGATFRSGWVNTDFILLELKNKMEAAYQLSWLGWDRNGKPASSGTSLHHPKGYDMKISFEHDNIYKYDKKISWRGGGGISLENTHWKTDFDEGITEGGASGGPLLDQNKRVIGQLHGGGNSEIGLTCEDRTSYYGCFDVSWEGGGTKETRLKDWLSPSSVSATNTSEIKFSISESGGEGIFVLKNYSSGVTVNWQVSSTDFYMEKLQENSVKVLPKKYGLTGTLNAKPNYFGRQVGDVSYSLYSSPLTIIGDTYLSAKEKRYKVNYIPYGGKLTWSYAPGITVKEKGADYIVITADKSTNPWLRATVTAAGTTTVKELKLRNETLTGAGMECLKVWRGTYNGQPCKKYAFRINYSPASIPEEDLTFCWSNSVQIDKPDGNPVLSPLTGQAKLITQGNIGLCLGTVIEDPSVFPPQKPFTAQNEDLIVYPPVIPDQDIMPDTWTNTTFHAVAIMPQIKPGEESSGYVNCRITDAAGKAFNIKSPAELFDKWQTEYHVSPNPASSTLTVTRESNGTVQSRSYSASDSGQMIVRLFSNAGVVRSASGTVESAVQLDTSALPDGNYTLNVVENGETVHSQVVIIKH